MQLERREIRLQDVQVKVGANGEGTFSGYGAVFGNIDSYGDVIEQGAFKQTLKEWKGRGKWPKMLLQHGGGFFGGSTLDGIPVGQYTHMNEDSHGLKLDGRLFALNTERGTYIHEGMKSGELDGLSIGFMVREFIAGTKAGEPDRRLTNIDLWEVSIVTFPANDKANVTSVKMKRELEEAFRDGGLSRADSLKAVSILSKFYQRDAGMPTITPCDEAMTDEETDFLAWLKEKAKVAEIESIMSHLQRSVA